MNENGVAAYLLLEDDLKVMGGPACAPCKEAGVDCVTGKRDKRGPKSGATRAWVKYVASPSPVNMDADAVFLAAITSRRTTLNPPMSTPRR